MKNIFTILVAIFSLSLFQIVQARQKKDSDPSLTKKWETDTLLRTPESVLFDPTNNILYVSNIDGKPGEKDGNGFISKVTLDGKIEKLEWIKGFDAPKGMGIYKNMLYVTDITRVIVIDIDLGEKVNSFEVAGSVFLNDITIDAKGIVYISDSNTKKIHKLENNKITDWFTDAYLVKINGLLALSDQLMMVDMGTGKFYSINYKDKKLIQKGEGLSGGDGIVAIDKNSYLVSNWNGEVNFINSQGDVKKLLDTKETKVNAADIEYVFKANLLLVPTFFKNSVSAYGFRNNKQ